LLQTDNDCDWRAREVIKFAACILAPRIF
jgi:hypothetical protein